MTKEDTVRLTTLNTDVNTIKKCFDSQDLIFAAFASVASNNLEESVQNITPVTTLYRLSKQLRRNGYGQTT